MTWQNLYFYHSCCDAFKKFKFYNPLPLYDLFNFSERSHSSLYINTPQPSDSFEYRTSVMWNVARQILNIPDATMPVYLFKNKLKKFLTEKQTLGDDINWIEHNYYPF